MADIKAALGSSFKSFMPSYKKKEEESTSPKRENPATFLKIIAKNFMSIHLMARDLNVARQNTQKLVKLEGGEPAKGADAFFLKAGEREKKLESEMAKEQEKKPEPVKPKKEKSFMQKIMEQFKVDKIIKAFQKYFLIAGILLIIWDLFKEAFVEWASNLYDTISQKFDEFVEKIKNWFEETIQPIIDKVKEFLKPFIEAIARVVDAIGNWFKEKIDWFAKEFPETFAFIKGVIDKVMVVVNFLKEKLDRIVRATREATAQLAEKTKEVAGRAATGVRRFFGLEKKEAKPKEPPKVREVVLDEKGRFKEAPVRPAPPPDSILIPSPDGTRPSPAPAPVPAPAPGGARKPSAAPEQLPSGTPGLIVNALNETGVTSPKAQANVLATVKAESNFKVQSENLNYSTPERIQQVFGAKRIPSVDFARQFVGNPEGLANYVYKTTDGNSAPGDGFKYRGRGFIQHTGKNQYAAISKATGVDVVSNPDALNSPEIAAKAIPWFFLGYKRLKPEDMDNMSKVNKAVAFADPTGKKALDREASAQQIYASMSGTSGTQVASSSTSLAQGQRESQKPSTPIVVNAPVTTTTVVNRTEVAKAPPPKDTATTLAARVA